MADPLALTIAGGDKVVAHACGKCRIVARSEADARACCAPKLCQCGATLERYRTSCETCRRDDRDRRELERINKAQKVSWRDYTGPVYLNGSGGNDGFHGDLDEFLESWMDEHETPPPFVWACDVEKFSMDATEIVSRELESQECYEDAFDRVGQRDIERLQKACDQLTAAAKIETWRETHNRIVNLDGYPVEAFRRDDATEAASNA